MDVTVPFVSTDPFEGFERKVRPDYSHFVMLTSYADDIKAPIAFPPLTLDDVLGEGLALLLGEQVGAEVGVVEGHGTTPGWTGGR